MILEPPVVLAPNRGNQLPVNIVKVASWPWPNLAARSEEGRHKFFSIAFKQLAFISAPLFALMLTLAIGYEVGTVGLIFIVPLSLLSAIAMGLGQTWIVDNAYSEGKFFWQIWWIPFYMQVYVIRRWAICWRPMFLIALGGGFYVWLLFYLMGDQLGPSMARNSKPPAVGPTLPNQSIAFDSIPRVPATRRSSSGRNSSTRSSNVLPQSTRSQIVVSPEVPSSNETVWSYEALAVPAAPSTNMPSNGAEASVVATQDRALSQPVLSPVFEEDDGFREWSNLTGSYKLVAKFDVVEGEFVQLKTRDGRRVRVEIAKLSREDRQFLEPILQSSPFEVVGGK